MCCCAIEPLRENRTSPTNAEVYNILQLSQRRTQPWLQITCTQNSVNFGYGYHTHTHPFNGPLSGTTRVRRYQKGKTNLDFPEARESEWQWHQLGHTQVCTSLQTDNHASTPQLSFFTGRMPFPPNQQCQSTEGKVI